MVAADIFHRAVAFGPFRPLPLQPGDRVITGSVAQVPVRPGDRVAADLGPLGRVELSILA